MNTAGKCPKACAATKSRHDFVADAEKDRGVEHIVRQGDRRRHSNDVAREKREFHAGAALRDAVAHGRHAACDLRDAARLVRRLFNEGGKTLIRLMRREHVVIGGDDGEIGGGTGTQGLLFAPGASGKTMREIGTSERATVRPATSHRLDAA